MTENKKDIKTTSTRVIPDEKLEITGYDERFFSEYLEKDREGCLRFYKEYPLMRKFYNYLKASNIHDTKQKKDKNTKLKVVKKKVVKKKL